MNMLLVIFIEQNSLQKKINFFHYKLDERVTRINDVPGKKNLINYKPLINCI